MAVCGAIARSGERCKGIAIDGSGWCHAHHPDRAEARRRAARKGGRRGGRGRPSTSATEEVEEVKRHLKALAGGVLSESVHRGDAAVVNQVLGSVLRALELERKIREQDELLERLEALERAQEEREEGGQRRGA